MRTRALLFVEMIVGGFIGVFSATATTDNCCCPGDTVFTACHAGIINGFAGSNNG